MLSRRLIAALLSVVLAACAPPAPGPVTPAVSPTPAASPHADAIRFALVGQPTDVNGWSLFDESGASYANYALHSDEYPRLYRLSIPEREFEPYVAEGMPSPVTQEAGFLTAGAALQPGLTWSDGSPLTAHDVAFTVETALVFRLGYDWRAAYRPDLLDRAEAVDDLTVKFYFSRPFNVGNWQYGALQGPILSRAYWSTKVAGAAAQLPSAELIEELEAVRAEVALMQARVDADHAQLLTTLPNSETYNELSRRVVRNQNELNSLNSRLVELQDEYDAALNAARAALFALDDDAEPTFGPFLRAVQSGEVFSRDVNPAYPFEQPNFDRVVYRVFADQHSAIAGLERGEINTILDELNPLNRDNVKEDLSIQWVINPTSSARFIVINPSRPALADPTFRRVLSCYVANWLGKTHITHTFVPSGNEYWYRTDNLDSCGVSEPDSSWAMAELRSAGYTWEFEGTQTSFPMGLKMPDGTAFPSITLLAPAVTRAGSEALVGDIISVNASSVAISLSVNTVSAEDIRYAVYSSGDYDMAIIGWRLSEYPGYLCDWFQISSPFDYGSQNLQAACNSFNSTADLETARQAAFQVQSILLGDLPFVAQYQVTRAEAYRAVKYPFDTLLNGITGLHGAPHLAIPAP